MHVAVWALPDDKAPAVPVATGYMMIHDMAGGCPSEWISLVNIASTEIQGLLLVSISPASAVNVETTDLSSPCSAVERAAGRLHLRNDLLELASLLEPLRPLY